MRLPANAQLAVASRDAPPLPLGLLRAQGAVLESASTTWSWTRTRPAELLDGLGDELAGTDAEDVVRRTEGWPVGIYLAALALRAGRGRSAAAVSFRGDDRAVATTCGPSCWRGCRRPAGRSSPARRCSTACAAPCAMPCSPASARAGCWRSWRDRTSCWSRSTGAGVVPLPPALPGPAARRAAPGRAGRDRRPAPPGGRWCEATTPRDGDLPRPGRRRRRHPRTPGHEAGDPHLRRRAAPHGGRVARLGSTTVT